MIAQLCMPALIYLVYVVIHILIDVYYGLYNMAFVEVWIGILGTLLLNILCENNMSAISWLIVSIPFVLMTVIAVFILVVLKLNPATGKTDTPSPIPPSKYAYPIAVTTPYYGILANSIRAVNSNL
jgi:hypothetical protein